MRSCDFFIFEAATISIALVIFRVFCTLRIFTRISFVPGISQSPSFRGAKRRGISFGTVCPQRSLASLRMTLERATLLPVLDRGLEILLRVGREVLLVLDRLYLRGVLALQVVAQRLVGGQRLGDLQA